MNMTRLLRRILLLAVIFLLGSIVWAKLISHSFVSVQLAGSTDSFTLVRGSDSRLVASGSTGGTYDLPVGDYLLSFMQGHATADIRTVHVGPFSKQNLKPSSQQPSLGASQLLNRAVQAPVAVGGGYLYVSSADRGVHYLDSAGHDSDISQRFGLATGTSAAAGNAAYDSVVTIASAHGSALVVTTAGVFLVRNGSDVTKLPAINDSTGIIAASEDSSTDVLYVLTAGGNTVYSYDTTQPAAVPLSVFKTDKTVNRLAAGGGKIAVYFDAVPNADPNLLAVYAQNKQLSPVLVDVPAKTAVILTAYTSPTLVAVSPNGTFLAVKNRFAAVMSLYDTKAAKVVGSLPAPDAGGLMWQQAILYFGRGGSVWSYDTASKRLSLTSELGTPVTDLWSSGNGVVAATGSGQLVTLAPGGGSFVPNVSPVEQLVGHTSLYQYYAAGP